MPLTGPSINVGGLKSKLKSNDFEDYISDYDIVCLSETKLNNLDTIEITNHKMYVNNFTSNKNIHGTALLACQSFNPFVHPLCGSCKNVT